MEIKVDSLEIFLLKIYSRSYSEWQRGKNYCVTVSYHKTSNFTKVTDSVYLNKLEKP